MKPVDFLAVRLYLYKKYEIWKERVYMNHNKKFSFGKTGCHSLTSVTFTPHTTSYEGVPTFGCQKKSEGFCSPVHLGNCNDCPAKPVTAFPYMANLARKYMLDDYKFEYRQSLFSMKPILMSSEIDDSRPTVIRKYSSNPTFVGVLSGKINTVYDLDEVLRDGE